MSVILYIFHRDFRLEDHNGLHFVQELLKQPAYKECKVLPLFIFTPEQVSEKNPYRSIHSMQFMIESLMELNSQLHKEKSRLFCFYDSNLACVEHLLSLPSLSIQAICETKDYTPFAKKRESDFRQWCMLRSISYFSPEDVYLTNPGTVLTGTGKTFQKFTPFWEVARTHPVAKPIRKVSLPWFTSRVALDREVHLVAMRKKWVPYENRRLHVKGGRSEGLSLLKNLPSLYDTTRDYPSLITSNLSAHNHYGTVSIREVFWAGKAKKIQEFIRQLYWRDFYGHIMNSFEELYGQEPFAFMKEASPGWKTDRNAFEKWSSGKTGHELVDAGMRQLNSTGYMHNRVRLVAASYLAKEERIHWRWGERYFATKLVDYDVTQNMMNWIWVSSVLPFASAPFRRLDPEVQAERVDPLKQYRAKWLSSDL
jgi:deoxyribodipyrimidine photo-lyase